MKSLSFWKLFAHIWIGFLALFALNFAHAGLFDDEEARKAILDLRLKVETNKVAQEASIAEQRKSLEKALEESNANSATMRRSLLELQSQIETLRAEVARLRGQDEQTARDMADLQRRQREVSQSTDERLRKFEPFKVSVDGREFVADPAERRDYEAALAIFRRGDFVVAQPALIDFVRRYPQSGYTPSVLFWLGNAQYATRDYREAITNLRSMLAQAADHTKAGEAMLAIANCQIELKDNRSARKTLEDLIQAYPQSEAAGAAKERLPKLK